MQDEMTLILNSNNRIDLTKTSNDAQYYFDWNNILCQGWYELSWSIYEIPPIIIMIPPEPI